MNTLIKKKFNIMKYSIEVLEKEKELLERCLSNWELKNYPEARKQRSNKLSDLITAIEILKR